MLQLVLVAVAATAAMVSADAAGRLGPIGLPSCTTSCGGVSVPYPFGISPGCSLPGFGLTCDTSRHPPRLLLGAATAGILKIAEISLTNSTVRVRGPEIGLPRSIIRLGTGNGTWGGPEWGLADDGPYKLSTEHNEFILTGCHVLGELLVTGTDAIISSCSSVCRITGVFDDLGRPLELPAQTGHRGSKCSGIGCCQAPIPVGLSSYWARLDNLPGGFKIPVLG